MVVKQAQGKESQQGEKEDLLSVYKDEALFSSPVSWLSHHLQDYQLLNHISSTLSYTFSEGFLYFLF